MAAWVSTQQRTKNIGNKYATVHVGDGSASPVCLDELVQGTGRWENMQEVIRTAIKSLLDTQAAHQQQIIAQGKKMRDLQASFSGPKKPRREEVARATAAAAEIGAGLFRLRADVSATSEDAKAEANDLLLRVESKASKEHVKACLDKKANKGELEDLRVRLDRLSEGADIVEAGEVHALRTRVLAVEKCVAEMDARVRGCEAHAIRADPAAFALRIETVSSRLEGLSKRVDHKASASATERALEHKVDKSALRAALKSKADRADLSSIQASAASLLDTSRDRAATAAAAFEQKLPAAAAAAAAAATASLRIRADGHDQALARLEATALVNKTAALTSTTADGMVGGRNRGCDCERGLRRIGRRVERVEGGLAAVATASAEAVARASETAGAVERHRKRSRERTDGKTKAFATAIEALTRQVAESEPSRQLETMQQMVENRVSAVAKESTAYATAAVAGRLSLFEREVQGILSDFSRRLTNQDGANAAAVASQHLLSPRRRRTEKRRSVSPPITGSGDTPPEAGSETPPCCCPTSAPAESAGQGNGNGEGSGKGSSNSDIFSAQPEGPGGGVWSTSRPGRAELAPRDATTRRGCGRQRHAGGTDRRRTSGPGACNGDRRGNCRREDSRDDDSTTARGDVAEAEEAMRGEGVLHRGSGTYAGSGTAGRSSSISSGSVAGVCPGETARAGSGGSGSRGAREGEREMTTADDTYRRRRLEELRREKETFREIAARGLYA